MNGEPRCTGVKGGNDRAERERGEGWRRREEGRYGRGEKRKNSNRTVEGIGGLRRRRKETGRGPKRDRGRTVKKETNTV